MFVYVHLLEVTYAKLMISLVQTHKWLDSKNRKWENVIFNIFQALNYT